tara:strand:+ start:289 stop:453 length:165 start_codon:yes stop_codon:yes gene_type:complete
MRVGDLVDDGLGNIGIITVANKDLPLPYFAQFFNTYDGNDITGWYTDGDLEVVT